MSGNQLAQAYGGFQLSGMNLALPMEALREVVPAEPWIPLPCAHTGIVGGVNLRGVVVPVLDLRPMLGRLAQDAPYPCVLIVVNQGHMLGVLADDVTGIFVADARGIHALSERERHDGVMSATVRRADSGGLTSILSAEALLAQPGLPLVDDPEPERQRVQEAQDGLAEEPDAGGLTLVLVRCGRVPLAVDALTVHATVARPEVLRSPLAMGHCRGVINHGGVLVPAVDLHGLCGLGRLVEDGHTQQAFIVALPAGQVALLVSEVMDVVQASIDDLVPVPAFALPAPDLMQRALPAQALAEDLVQRLDMSGKQFLMIENDALRAHPDLLGLADANAREQGVSADTRAFVQGVQASHIKGSGRAMLTYALNSETATPLDQVQEILPFCRSVSIFESNGVLLGFTTHQGRSIPVLCLSRLAGGQTPEATPSASVLIVSSGDDLVGFAVPSLRSIEQAEWEPELPDHQLGGGALSARFRSKQLALLRSAQGERMLPVLDLQHLAQLVREREIDVMACGGC